MNYEWIVPANHSLVGNYPHQCEQKFLEKFSIFIYPTPWASSFLFYVCMENVIYINTKGLHSANTKQINKTWKWWFTAFNFLHIMKTVFNFATHHFWRIDSLKKCHLFSFPVLKFVSKIVMSIIWYDNYQTKLRLNFIRPPPITLHKSQIYRKKYQSAL